MHPSPGTGKQGNSLAWRDSGLHRHPFAISCRIALRFQPCRVIHGMTAQPAEQKTLTMTTFTIDTDNNITAHATAEEAAAQLPPRSILSAANRSSPNGLHLG